MEGMEEKRAAVQAAVDKFEEIFPGLMSEAEDCYEFRFEPEELEPLRIAFYSVVQMALPGSRIVRVPTPWTLSGVKVCVCLEGEADPVLEAPPAPEYPEEVKWLAALVLDNLRSRLAPATALDLYRNSMGPQEER